MRKMYHLLLVFILSNLVFIPFTQASGIDSFLEDNMVIEFSKNSYVEGVYYNGKYNIDKNYLHSLNGTLQSQFKESLDLNITQCFLMNKSNNTWELASSSFNGVYKTTEPVCLRWDNKKLHIIVDNSLKEWELLCRGGYHGRVCNSPFSKTLVMATVVNQVLFAALSFGIFPFLEIVHWELVPRSASVDPDRVKQAVLSTGLASYYIKQSLLESRDINYIYSFMDDKEYKNIALSALSSFSESELKNVLGTRKTQKIQLLVSESTNADTQFNLGNMYARGQGVTRDDLKAMQLFQKAADLGSVEAQFKLGYMYYDGQGVVQDYKQAAAWYKKAADLGKVEAQLNLGNMYYDGQGVDQDYKQAAAWYEKAASYGDAYAQFSLGFMYEKGEGVTQNSKLAAEWYHKSADQGDAKAKQFLETLELNEGIVFLSNYQVNYINSRKSNLLHDVQNLIQTKMTDYLAIETIPEPVLPPAPQLVKDEFEKAVDFKMRVELALKQRQDLVNQAQEEYRTKVEARNADLQKREQNKNQYANEMAISAFKQSMLGINITKMEYDADKETMYVTVASPVSDFERQVSLTMNPEEAKSLKQSPENAKVLAEFKVDSQNIVLNSVKVTLYKKDYTAALQEEKYAPTVVSFQVPNSNIASVYQNPNLIDGLQIAAPTYAEKLEKGSISFIDDLKDVVAKSEAQTVDSKKWLFVVAVEDYKNADKVIYAKNSAELLTKTMQKRLGISERNTYALIDVDATAGAITDQLEKMLQNVKPDDTVYFYYSGHGVPDQTSQEAYILPRDKVVNFVTREEQLRLSSIYQKLENSAAGHIYAFVDSCFSGRTDNISNFKGVAPGLFRTKNIEVDATKMVVLTAGKNTQFSNAYNEKGHRLFSYFLIKSLLKPRSSQDTINQLYQEVTINVHDESFKKGDAYVQDPQIYGNTALPL